MRATTSDEDDDDEEWIDASGFPHAACRRLTRLNYPDTNG